jgi:hypothetical protein
MRIRPPDKGGCPPSQTEAALLLRTIALLVLLATPALATDVRVDGSYRLRLASNTNEVLDDTGTTIGQSHWLEHRLRLTPKIIEDNVLEIQASFDVVSGLLAGDVANDFRGYGWTGRSDAHGGLHASGFDFRHFFVELKLPVGILQFGQMPSHWGMGMVANGGNGEEETDFGDVRFGDIVDRLMFVTRPLVGLLGTRSFLAQHLATALAGDLVYRDRYAQLIESAPGNGLRIGDTAFQGVAAAILDLSEASRVGFYAARRVQSFALDGGDLHIWIFDLHARTLFQPESLPVTISLEAEAAQIYGGTSHAPSLNAPGNSRVNQQGAVLRTLVSKGPLEAELEGGYASGRANPFDDQVTAFQMNRDFKVGLVLWDEVLLFETQNAARRLSDPRLLGRPPPGLDLVPTEGAVTNALYLKPTLRYRPGFLSGKVRAVASVLFARAPEPVIDLYQALVSSSARNSFGAPAKHGYGTELDFALGYRTRIASDQLGAELGVQSGYLIPGDAFDRADGTRMPGVWVGKLRGTLIF